MAAETSSNGGIYPQIPLVFVRIIQHRNDIILQIEFRIQRIPPVARRDLDIEIRPREVVEIVADPYLSLQIADHAAISVVESRKVRKLTSPSST